ncbi:MAG: alpha/beta fold hydrolase [Christensenellales bacterium]|jgi:pimeloyl-ACP methyl ester carboxylesterase
MKKKKRHTVALVALGLVALVAIWSLIQRITLQGALKEAEARLASYGAQVLDLPQGQMSYVDRGEGPAILVSHGISGGFDQAYDAVAGKESKYRLLAPSRFGYPGSSLPADASVKAQATAFAQLLDALDIDAAYVLGTSAGGTPAIRFALDYPKRCKGLILYSSAMPETSPPQTYSAYQGPPAFTLNDFVMWAFRGLFSPLMGMEPDTVRDMLPMRLRRDGMLLDAQVTNPDMARNYPDYPIEEIACPVLIVGAKDDKLVDVAAMERAAPRFQTHQLLLFESGGHMMQGHGQEVEAALDRFISDIEQAKR